MYRIAICDDDLIFLDSLKQTILSYFSDANLPYQIDTYTNGLELLSAAHELYDLYFLDYSMPAINGIDLAQELKSNKSWNNTNQIIFISNIYDAVFNSFQVSPLRFIRKEYASSEVIEALEVYLKYRARNDYTEYVIFQHNNVVQKISIKNILYIEASGHYLNIYTSGDSYRIREKITVFSQKLPMQMFGTVHQGCIVNYMHIHSISKDSVILDNQQNLFLSKIHKKTFISAFMRWERMQSHVLIT